MSFKIEQKLFLKIYVLPKISSLHILPHLDTQCAAVMTCRRLTRDPEQKLGPLTPPIPITVSGAQQVNNVTANLALLKFVSVSFSENVRLKNRKLIRTYFDLRR